MSHTCTLSLALLLAGGLAAQRSETLIVHFPLASAELNPADQAILGALCDRPDIDRLGSITLRGYTDHSGSPAYNGTLRERRTKAVKTVLEAGCLQGIPTDLDWSGHAGPQASTSAGAVDRRVEVLLTFEDGAATTFIPCPAGGIVPLLPSIDKPHERVAVNASSPIDVTMSDGTRVLIPAGTIVDAKGDPVNGEVELRYRGFQEPYEIIASGIPMHVNTPEGVRHMESAGMYEITASVNGQPLALAPGGSITLEPVDPPGPDEGFISWVLNEQTGQWSPGGTLTLTAPVAPTEPLASTPATQAYWTELYRLENEAAPDSTSFEERRRSASYCHLAACDTTAGGTGWIKRRNRFRDEGGVPEISVKAYKGIYDPEHLVFGISMRGHNLRQFPEWRRVPNNALFAYTGPEPRRVFKQLYGRRHFFQDIHLDIASGATEGTLWLKENGQWLELPVSVEHDAATPLSLARWDRATTSYAKALARHRTTFDREVNKRVARYKRAHRDMPLSAWKEARDEMNSGEKDMDLQAWLAYAKERPYRVPTTPGASPWAMFAKTRTSYSIYGFGKVNVDRYLVMPEQVNVIASTTDAEGEPFRWVRAYAVPKGRNAVITYQGKGEGRADAMLIAPGLMRSLFLVNADGQVVSADVAPLNSGKMRVELKITPLNDPKSIDELRAQVDP